MPLLPYENADKHAESRTNLLKDLPLPPLETPWVGAQRVKAAAPATGFASNNPKDLKPPCPRSQIRPGA